MKIRATLPLLPLLALLVTAAPAHAAGDPIANGSLELRVAGAFKKQLKKNHASLSQASLAIEQGTVDPINGEASLKLAGKLRLKHGHRKLSYGNLTATLGDNGALMSGKTRLFSLSGGSVTRNGFGAQLGGVKLKLGKASARKIDRKLGLRSLRPGSAGSLTVSEQPQTVQLTGGSAKVSAYLTNVAGSVATKLKYHCINPVTGITPIGAAIEPGGLATPYFFPISGGTISPAGTDGLIQQSGGLELQNIHGDTGDGVVNKCKGSGAPPLAKLDEFDFAFDLKQNTVKSHVVISNHPTAPNGDQGTVVQASLDSSSLKVSLDPEGHTVTATGGVIRINSGTALYLNQVFPQPLASFDASKEFVAGDLFAAADISATVR
jgi:hypothetical protein